MRNKGPRSPGRTARRKNKKAIEQKRTFGEIVATMNDRLVYSFDDGPIAGKSFTGQQWKAILAANENIMKKKPADMPIEEYVKQVMTNGHTNEGGNDTGGDTEAPVADEQPPDGDGGRLPGADAPEAGGSLEQPAHPGTEDVVRPAGDGGNA